MKNKVLVDIVKSKNVVISYGTDVMLLNDALKDKDICRIIDNKLNNNRNINSCRCHSATYDEKQIHRIAK